MALRHLFKRNIRVKGNIRIKVPEKLANNANGQFGENTERLEIIMQTRIPAKTIVPNFTMSA